MTFIDLSQTFEDNMPGFKLKNEDGSFTEYTAKVRPFLTHEDSKPKFQGQCSFEITEVQFQTSVGTYLDSPSHRYPEARDISEISLKEVILDGVVIDIRNKMPFEEVDVDLQSFDLSGKAVLFNFGWSKYWKNEEYYSYPFIGEKLIYQLVEQKVGLVGVDTINIDNSNNIARPAHTLLLKNDILIVENLTNLDKLYNRNFRFFAIPIKAKGAAAMTVRAFAEVL